MCKRVSGGFNVHVILRRRFYTAVFAAYITLDCEMSNLQSLLLSAKEGLALGQSIPQSQWSKIAAQCGPNELAEIHIRIAKLRAELEAVEEWDGDTQDDIHIALNFFTQLALLCT